MLGCAVPLSNLLEGLKVSDGGMMADCCEVPIRKIDAGELSTLALGIISTLRAMNKGWPRCFSKRREISLSSHCSCDKKMTLFDYL